MKKMFKSWKVILMGLLSFTLLSSTSYAATIDSTNSSTKSNQSIISTCDSKAKMDKDNVVGSEKDTYIKQALKDPQIKEDLKQMKKDGYKLDKKNIIVKQIESASNPTEVNVVFTTLKSSKEYRLVEWNNFGNTRIIDVSNGEVNLNYTLPGTIQPHLVYCWACAGVCFSLIEAPPAFASCIAMCTVFCA